MSYREKLRPHAPGVDGVEGSKLSIVLVSLANVKAGILTVKEAMDEVFAAFILIEDKGERLPMLPTTMAKMLMEASPEELRKFLSNPHVEAVSGKLN